LSADRVVAVMKYHVFRGRLGCLRIAVSSAGVRMGVTTAMTRTALQNKCSIVEN
jgi:hypothetical protein